MSEIFTEKELRLIESCKRRAENRPIDISGTNNDMHNLWLIQDYTVIIAKLMRLIEEYQLGVSALQADRD